MKYIMIFATTLVLTSCSSDEEVLLTSNDLIGKWALIETLSDPGDGSGVYHSVESDKTITFSIDGSFSSNGAMCSFGLEVDDQSSGTYDTDNMTISPDDCTFNLAYSFEGENLILGFPCIEACGHKYVKVVNEAVD